MASIETQNMVIKLNCIISLQGFTLDSV